MVIASANDVNDINKPIFAIIFNLGICSLKSSENIIFFNQKVPYYLIHKIL